MAVHSAELRPGVWLSQRCAALHCDEAFVIDDDLYQDEELSTCEPTCSVSSDASCSTGIKQVPSSPEEAKQSLAYCSEADDLLLEQQDSSKCPSSYLSTTQASTGLTPVHRATIVDNMIAAAAQLGLSNDSLFTAVACLDRYLAAKVTPLPLLQPTAIACCWVAAKYEQLVVPSVAHFAALVQGSDQTAGGSIHLSKQLLVELESDILATLDYRLAAIVTVKSFKNSLMQRLQHSCTAATLAQRQLDQLYCMTSYLTEVSLLEYRLLSCQPSQVAAAAFVYAHVLLGLQVSHALQLTGYSLQDLSQLLEMFCALHSTLSAALQLGRPYNVTSKYRDPSVRGVAHIPPMMLPGQQQRASGW